MVKLVKGQANRIPVKVVSLIDYTGFSAVLEMGVGAPKSIPNLKAANAHVDFSEAEIDGMEGEMALGTLTVSNAANEVHMKMLIRFKPVDTYGEAQGFQKISVVIVSAFKYDWAASGSELPTEEIARMIDEKVEPAVEKAMTESVDQKVEEHVDEIIDDKVSQVVDGIVDEKVETTVDAVIDTKVDERIDELLDSSDSDALGGIINNLQTTVYDDLNPRVTVLEGTIKDDIQLRLANVEQVAESRVSMEDYSDSDEGIIFRI